MHTVARASQPQALKALRERSGFTVTAFATEIMIVPGHLSNIEAGRRQASPDVVRRMAEVLKVPLPALLLDPEKVA